jgi:hypothetical protein
MFKVVISVLAREAFVALVFPLGIICVRVSGFTSEVIGAASNPSSEFFKRSTHRLAHHITKQSTHCRRDVLRHFWFG